MRAMFPDKMLEWSGTSPRSLVADKHVEMGVCSDGGQQSSGSQEWGGVTDVNGGGEKVGVDDIMTSGSATGMRKSVYSDHTILHANAKIQYNRQQNNLDYTYVTYLQLHWVAHSWEEEHTTPLVHMSVLRSTLSWCSCWHWHAELMSVSVERRQLHGSCCTHTQDSWD